MSCSVSCPRELVSQDSVSPGPIEPAETVARGAYDPSHGKAGKATIKPAFIDKRALASSELSIWRLGATPVGLPLPRLKAIMRITGGGRKLFAVGMALASDVRGVSLETTGHRALCVVDECDCDQSGNKHPAHGHIKLCPHLEGGGLHADSPEIKELQLKLRHIFMQSLHLRFTSASSTSSAA